MGLRLAYGLVLIVFVPAGVFAQDPDYVLSLVPGDSEVVAGDDLAVEVRLESSALSVAGFQFDVCNDAFVDISLDDVELAGALEDVDYEFYQLGFGSGGWSANVLLATGSELAAGAPHTLFSATYALLETGTSAFTFCGDLHEPLVTTATGSTVEPVTVDGFIEIIHVPEYTYRASDLVVPYDPLVGSASFTVALTIAPRQFPAEVYGFGLALAHDAELLEITDARLVGEAATLSILYTSYMSVADGFVWGVAYDFMSPTWLVFEAEEVVAEIDYSVLHDVLTGDTDGAVTEIAFSETLVDADGNMQANWNAVVGTPDGEYLASNGTLATDNALIELVADLPPPPPPLFKRGDADGNGRVIALVDAIHVLKWAFSGGSAPPCLDAADVDGNNISNGLQDGLRLLRWGFTDGPAPPAPGPDTCGADDDLDAEITCATPPSCS